MIWLLGLACYRAEEPRCQPGEEAKKGKVVSPAPESHITNSPWIPILLRVHRLDGEEILTCLDGRKVDTSPVVRNRAKALGGGRDLVDALDLQGVEPGEHRLDWSVDGRWYSSSFVYDRPPNRVLLRVVDGEGRSVPARVVVTRDGQRWSLATPDARKADPRKREDKVAGVFVDGERELWLEDGSYELLAVRGIRDSLGVAEVTLGGGGQVELTLTVERVLSPWGTMAADLHMHTVQSVDAFVPEALRAASLLASGLDAVVLTDHGKVRMPLEELAAMATLQGVELAYLRDDKHVAHVNAFPLERMPAELLIDYSAPQVLRTVDPQPLLQINHPRGIHFRPETAPHDDLNALFYDRGLDVSQPVTLEEHPWLADYDAVEVFNRFSFPLYLQARRDWMGLMNQGFQMTGTGNSDSHATEVELAGLPCNLVPCPPEDLDCLVRELREGRVVVSSGPVVDLELNGARPGELTSGGQLTARLHVQAPDWVLVDEVRLVVNGEVVTTIPLGTFGADERLEIPLELERDSFVLAEAGWPLDREVPDDLSVLGRYALVAPGYVPVGFTNPVRVDADGDGAFTPPGPP